MNKGYLGYSEEEGLTMLKEDPDDLTHLAPSAGDVISFGDTPLSVLDEFLLRDEFIPMLNDGPVDPFMYRDPCEASPQMLSPNLQSLDSSPSSLNSPAASLTEDEQLTTFMNLQMDDDSDFIMKNSYMNVSDDIPLMADDLMWSSTNKNKICPENTSSLAQLLSNTIGKHSMKPSDHGGTMLQNNYDKAQSNKWAAFNKITTQQHQRTERLTQNGSSKRSSPSSFDVASKRMKSERTANVTSELLQQLMANDHQSRNRSKGKGNWLLETDSRKAACISQPSDSVLMNLLDQQCLDAVDTEDATTATLLRCSSASPASYIRKASISLLDPEADGITSLMDLTQQDCEVNAPANQLLLLQGEELITALETGGGSL